MQQLSSHINSKLGKQARLLLNLEHLVKSALPKPAHAHIQIANILDRELVLATDSPAWSTRLRLHSREILYMLATHTDLDIHSVRIRLLKHLHTKTTTPQKPPKLLSRNSADIITRTAHAISDPALKQTLLKLAKRQSNAE